MDNNQRYRRDRRESDFEQSLISTESDEFQSAGTIHTGNSQRPLLDRHCSAGDMPSSIANIPRGPTAVRQQSTPAVSVTNSVATSTASYVDLASLQASWANTNGEDLFGSSMTYGGSSSMFGSLSSFRPPALMTSTSLPASMVMSSSMRVDSTSGIHDAARITDWDRVLELCASHPQFAQYKGVDGWTALHHSCNRRCPRPEVVEALIEAYPDALLAEEEKGWLPLHYACRFKAPKEVVKLLLYMRTDMGKIGVSRKDRLGRTPLYYAVRYDAPPGVVNLLLQVNPAAVLEEDQHDESPLALVWNTWADKMEGKRVIRSLLPGGFPEPEGVTEEERTRQLWDKVRAQPKLLKRWQKVNMLLKAAFGFPEEDDDEEGGGTPSKDDNASASIGSDRAWRIVHATSAVKCHLSLFLLACALHPEQARELDESDLRRPSDPMLSGLSTHQTALHLAASSNAGGSSGRTVIQGLLDLYRNAAHVQDAVDGSLPLHLIVENSYKQDWPNFGALLYHVYPRGLQIPDHYGKLPLHRAASAIPHGVATGGEDYTNTSVIMNVVRLYPQAASHLDNAGCLPFHILSMHAGGWDDNVESVYNAHRAAIQARTGAAFENRLPIHFACGNVHATEQLITKLVRLHPRGASISDRQGRLPFHMACEIGKEWDHGVSVVYDAFPAAVRQAEQNARGWTPLHMAAHCKESSFFLIEKLVALNPAAADIPDNQGRYPLHLACEAGKRWDIGLETLFNASPNSLGAADDKGLLPFHIAAVRYCITMAQKTEEDLALGVEIPDDTETSLCELENLYQLLRADPSVIG